MAKKYSISFFLGTGWLCELGANPKCEVCGKKFLSGDSCLYLKKPDALVCEICFESERAKGKFWNIDEAVPVTLAKDVPKEFGEEW